MAKALDKGNDKIQEICSLLRNETIDPAKTEAEKIIEEAHAKARDIIKEAEKEAERIVDEGKNDLEKEKEVFNSTLKQAAKLTLESLTQRLEDQFFNQQLNAFVDREGAKPEVIAKCIDAMISAIKEEGISANLEARIPKTVSVEEVNRLLAKGVLDQLKDGSVKIADFEAGSKVKIEDKQMTLDLSGEVIKRLIAQYVRKDFRPIIFAVNPGE